MKITENVQNNVSRIFLDGRFDANTCGEVEQFIRKRIDDGMHYFVLDMENVSFIASAGLRVVLVIAKELRNTSRGDLCIASPQPNVRKVFEISGIDNVLQIHEDVERAAKGFLQ
ncbi:MAG: STAS domain-containing protein [Deltaproteobacteria bacterium]|nr:STAS domain-containing protein [Deltaproteobacteria bacterium]